MGKPHLKLVGNELVAAERPLSPAVQKAKEKYGKRFAHEKGSTFRPRETPLLTEWLSTRTREAK